VIAAAEASGCIALIIGMESGNPDVLRRIAKPGTVDVFLAASRCCAGTSASTRTST
jgi:radical SAM superfamily enzyme YgiQ (UPF0313 family)